MRFLFALLLLVLAHPPGSEDEPSTAVPESLATFEPLVGEWTGMAIPAADRLRGWRETHDWAWRFDKGRPVGLNWSLKASKSLSSARIDPDLKHKGQYVMIGQSTDGNPRLYLGKADETGRVITFDRTDATSTGKNEQERLVLRIQSSGARYTVWSEIRSPDATSWKRMVEVNLGRPADAVAARHEDQGPKCIVTGGAASMTVTVGGRSLPICCTGCRDEVLADPDKYLHKITGPVTRTEPAATPPQAEPEK